MLHLGHARLHLRYRSLALQDSGHTDPGRQMGHEPIGVVEALGNRRPQPEGRHLVVMPFAYSDGTCVFCHEGLQTFVHPRRFLRHGSRRRSAGRGGSRSRAPTGFSSCGGKDDVLMPSLLTLSDVWARATTPPSPRR